MIIVPEGFSVRRASMEDIAEVVRLRVAMQMEHRAENRISEEYLDATKKSFEELLADDYYRGWLAFSEDVEKPIGLAGYLTIHHPPKPERIKQDRAYVISVYTEPAYRFKGVGRALMQTLIEHARISGYRRLELRASEEGRRLYSKLGFEPQEVWMLEL